MGTILNTSGAVIREYTWSERALSFDWDGRNGSGNVVSDGEYTYSISATDKAGNTAAYRLRNFLLDTTPTPVETAARASSFSPNGDGINDSVELELKPLVTTGILGWHYSILNEAGREVFQFSGREPVPPVLQWQGTDAAGNIQEGTFQGKLEVEYQKGNLAEADLPAPFTIDLSPPVVVSTITPAILSPDGDGENDRITLKVEVSDSFNTVQ